LQEWPDVAVTPGVVNHQQTILVFQLKGQLARRVLGVNEPGALTGERGIDFHEFIEQVGRLPQSHPEDAVIECVDASIIMADRGSQRCLAESTRPPARRWPTTGCCRLSAADRGRFGLAWTRYRSSPEVVAP
jgi:hypothetical protein